MKQKYDFGEKKVETKPDNLQESTELVKEQYDFVTEAGVWMNAAKGVNAIARNTYRSNIMAGAGAGMIVGGAGNVAKNMVKRDDDPTKKGFFGSLASGAAKGAAVGGTIGGAARFATGRSLAKTGIAKLNNQAAIEAAKNAGGNATKQLNAWKDAHRELGNVTGVFNGKNTAVVDTGRHMNHLTNQDLRRISAPDFT